MPIDSSETYDEALRQKTWHEAERKPLELALGQPAYCRSAIPKFRRLKSITTWHQAPSDSIVVTGVLKSIPV
jgi:hypothetical protein